MDGAGFPASLFLADVLTQLFVRRRPRGPLKGPRVPLKDPGVERTNEKLGQHVRKKKKEELETQLPPHTVALPNQVATNKITQQPYLE